jgi:predicted dehydrogenase
MKDTLNFALIGTGVIAKVHAKAINKIRGARLYAICSLAKEDAESFSREYGGKAYESYDEILKDADVDVVDIVCPNHLHADFAIKAALSGKHAIVEKPIDICVEKAEKLVETCMEKGVKLSVISQHRYRGNIEKLKDAIDSGKFGKPLAMSFMIRWHRDDDYYKQSKWRGCADMAGGGVLMLQAIHYIDIAQWLLGPVESVVSSTGTLKHHIDVEDFGVAVLKFKNGAAAVIEGLTFSSKTLDDRIEFFGENGCAVLEGDRIVEWNVGGYSKPNILKSLTTSRIMSAIPLRKASIRAQLEDIVDCIRNGGEVMVDGREGLKTLKIVDAIYKSAKLKKEVSVS